MNAIANTATATGQLDLMSAPRPAKAGRPPRGSRKVAKPRFLESGLPQWLVSGSAEQAASPAFKVHVLMDGETIEITQPLRHQLLCSQGTLWITHDGWPADHIVEQGQHCLAAISARMLVQA